MIHLVGHSLGAHLVGKAGREFSKETRGKKVGWVTGEIQLRQHWRFYCTIVHCYIGLDPAGPGWVGNTPFKEVKNEKLR